MGAIHPISWRPLAIATAAGAPSPATIPPLRSGDNETAQLGGGFFLYVIETLQISGSLRLPGFKDPTTRITTPPSDHIPLGGVVRFSVLRAGLSSLRRAKKRPQRGGELRPPVSELRLQGYNQGRLPAEVLALG